MPKKNAKIEKGLSQAADIILDLLAGLPKKSSAKAIEEIRSLAAKPPRSAYRGRAS
jgi:hypothetical protein